MYTSGSRGGCEGNYPFCVFAVYELLGEGRKGCRWVLLSGAVFLACIPAERNVSVRGCFVSCYSHSSTPSPHPPSLWGFLHSAAALFVCIPADRTASVCLFFFRAPAVCLSRNGWVGGGGSGVSLLSTSALLVCMPADREGKCVGHCSLLRFHHSIYTDWVGDGTVSVALNLRVGACSMHARGSGGS